MASVVQAWDYIGQGQRFPIKSGVTVANGDLVTLDSNGQVVLADRDAPVGCTGFASFTDGLNTAARVGVADLSVFTSIARLGIINGLSGLTIGGCIYTSTTAGGYTGTKTTTDTELRQCVGFAIAADTVQVAIRPNDLKYQTAAASVAAFI